MMLRAFVASCLLTLASSVSAQTLPACTGHGKHDRPTMKRRSLDHFTAAELFADELLAVPVPVHPSRADDPADDFESTVWRVPLAYVWLAKISPDDCDLHLEISAEPRRTAPRFIAEIPAADRDGQLAAVKALGLRRLGRSPLRLRLPAAVSVSGWGFFDASHACAAHPTRGCQHGSAAVVTLAELHPAVLGPPAYDQRKTANQTADSRRNPHSR